jgi:superfamily II DNA/RNA helicase
VPKLEQKKALKGDKELRIVVGTPGRLIDLVNDEAVDFSKCVDFAQCGSNY